MKVVLVSLNSSFVHTNLAIQYLKSVLKNHGVDAHILEMTINDRHPNMLQSLVRQKGDIYLFSCYIWNIEQTLKLIADLKGILKTCIVGVGGPEVSFKPREILKNNPIDYVMCGEGEALVFPLIEAIIKGETVVNDHIATTEHPVGSVAVLEDILKIPFVYENQTKYDKIVYYESSRGCPYACTYCLSSTIKGVRHLNTQRVKDELTYMAKSGASLVKLVDRTFNCNPKRAYELWAYLAELPYETTFHFEICAHLLDEPTLALLKTVPANRFQFEIGVQSTNETTLKEINRRTDLKKCIENVKRLNEQGNIPLHLDLIAGLPFEDFESFARSFNEIYPIAQVLQLGFLKVLSGSEIEKRQEEYGYVTSLFPPYEVFQSNWLSYEEILFLKDVEEIVEWYHNSGVFAKSLPLLLGAFHTPFDFFKAYGIYLRGRNFYASPHSQKSLYEPLYEFGLTQGIEKSVLQGCIRMDYILYQGLQNPPFLQVVYDKGFKKRCSDYVKKNYDERVKDVSRQVAFHLFDNHVLMFHGQLKTITDVTLRL